ncbi:MAG: malonyl-CoA synthase [Steroidobacteraceae bacterium]
MNNNLYLRFKNQHWRGEQPFIRGIDGAVISYADMDARSAQLANALRALNVQEDDRVVVQVEKSAAALLLYLACLRIGAVYVPLNNAYTIAELEYFIADAEPSLVVCAPDKQQPVQRIVVTLSRCVIATLSSDGMSGSLVALADVQSDRFDTVARGDNDLAAILYTSGTTGRSKGAMLTHDNLGSNCFTLKDCWHYRAGDVLLHALPIFHTHGLFVATNVTLAAGASMILLPKFDPGTIHRLMPQATVLMGVPTFYVRLLQEKWLDSQATQHMRLFISGSAPLLADTHRTWRERTGHAILERYGMTETNMNTSNPYEGERVPGTVGLPLQGVTVRVVDQERGMPQGGDAIGMLEVKGPNVFSGYWRMPEKTQAEFRDDGFFITGDLGKIDAQGYVHIVGRGKDLIITGGFNVYPKEVENEIDALPGVEESAVIGVPHNDFGEGVTAVVVATQPIEVSLNEATVIASLKQRLAAFKVPKRVIFVNALPRNTMGKVQKNVLRDTYRDIYQQVGN